MTLKENHFAERHLSDVLDSTVVLPLLYVLLIVLHKKTYFCLVITVFHEVYIVCQVGCICNGDSNTDGLREAVRVALHGGAQVCITNY